MKQMLTILFISVLTIIQILTAQIPHTMSYQGVLTDADGNPVPDGAVELTFKLYDTAENGDALWEENQEVNVTDGIFNVILGSETPLNLPFDAPYWLSIAVNGEEEMTPRLALTASPYSLNAKSTLVEPEPGQDLIIRDESGNTTHIFSAEGDVTHTGRGTFVGGIVVGDSIPELPDTSEFSGLFSKQDMEIANENSPGLPDVGTASGGNVRGIHGWSNSGVGVRGQSNSGPGVVGQSNSRTGVVGVSHSDIFEGVFGSNSSSGPGVRGTSVNGVGVRGFSVNGVGVIGISGDGTNPAVYAQGHVKIDDVPEAPDQERFVVWDNDNILKYRTLDASGFFSCFTCDDNIFVVPGEIQTPKVTTEEVETDRIKAEEAETHNLKADTIKSNSIETESTIMNDTPTGLIIAQKNGSEPPTQVAFYSPHADVVIHQPEQTDVAIATDPSITSDNNTPPNVGLAVYYPNPNPSTKIGIQSEVRGTGPAGWFIKSVTSNSENTLTVTNEMSKVQMPPMAIPDATLAKSVQEQQTPALWGLTNLNEVPAVLGQVSSTDSFHPAVWGYHTGMGVAVNGHISNNSSTSPAIWGVTNGSGPGVHATVTGNGAAIVADHQGSDGNIALFQNNSTNQARIDKEGKGFFNGGTQTGGADLAEAFEVRGLVESYEPGDVLVIATGRDRTMEKSQEPYSPLIAGIYATKPGVLLSERDIDAAHDDTIPVGIVGVIPTKVTGENGPIRRGDLLVTSSTPAHAMKGTDRDRLLGATIGKALEEFDGEGTGVIRVLVNVK